MDEKGHIHHVTKEMIIDTIIILDIKDEYKLRNGLGILLGENASMSCTIRNNSGLVK